MRPHEQELQRIDRLDAGKSTHRFQSSSQYPLCSTLNASSVPLQVPQDTPSIRLRKHLLYPLHCHLSRSQERLGRPPCLRCRRSSKEQIPHDQAPDDEDGQKVRQRDLIVGHVCNRETVRSVDRELWEGAFGSLVGGQCCRCRVVLIRRAQWRSRRL